MNPQPSNNRWRRTRWVGMLCLATVCVTGGCAADPAAQTATPTTTVTAVATPTPSASPGATAGLLSTQGKGVTREDYLYLLVALGSNDAVEETAARSAQAARDAVAALEASLQGRYDLNIDDGGVVALPLSDSELRTFEESVEDQARQDGARGLELYMTKLGHALDTIGPHVLARYDGIVATVMLDMPNAGLWLSPAGATDGIYLPGVYAQATRSIDVMTENITVVDRATKQESTRVLAHEIGHRLGLGHAGTTRCQQQPATPWDGTLPVRIAGRDCWSEEYGDTTNIMGQTQTGKAAPEGELLNALQLHQLGILPADQIIDIPLRTTAGTVLEYELNTLTSEDRGVTLIALPAGANPVAPPAEAPAPTQFRPYLVFSPEYGQSTDPEVPPSFTHNSLKVIYAPSNGGGRGGIAENILAVPLTRDDDDFSWPDDIGAPPTHLGFVFIDSSGNTVSILKQGPTSAVVRIELEATPLD